MYKDLLGNTLSIGDSVFLVKTFVQKHYAHTSSDFDDYDDDDILDKELEDARKEYQNNDHQDIEVSQEDNDFDYYISDNKKINYRKKDKFIDEDLLNEEPLQKNDKIQVLPSHGSSEDQLPMGRILLIEPSKIDKINQLKITINRLIEADNANNYSIDIDDYLYSGVINQSEYNNEILKRNKIINSINTTYLRPEQQLSKVYIQLEDNNGSPLRSKLISLIDYINNQLHDSENKFIKVFNLTENIIFQKAEDYRKKLPQQLQTITTKEIFEIYPTSIIESLIGLGSKTENLTFNKKELNRFHKYLNSVVEYYKEKQNMDIISNGALEAIINKMINKKPEYITIINNFKNGNDIRYFLKYKSFSEDTSLFKKGENIINLTYDQIKSYVDLISYILSCLKYKDGFKIYSIDDISKFSNTNLSVNTTINKIAIDIEQWFISNESKILKSIFR